jgi:hypothetical protein
MRRRAFFATFASDRHRASPLKSRARPHHGGMRDLRMRCVDTASDGFTSSVSDDSAESDVAVSASIRAAQVAKLAT